MAENSVLKLNGVDFSRKIADLDLGYQTLVSGQSGRATDGYNKLYVIRTVKKLTVQFNSMGKEDMQAFLAEVNKFLVSCYFEDAETGQYGTIKTNVSDRVIKLIKQRAAQRKYASFSVSFVEI